jgi:hypothetical protein
MQEAADFAGAGRQSFGSVLRNVPQIARNHDLCFHLEQRSSSHAKELSKLSSGDSALTFRDVTGNRNR